MKCKDTLFQTASFYTQFQGLLLLIYKVTFYDHEIIKKIKVWQSMLWSLSTTKPVSKDFWSKYVDCSSYQAKKDRK